MKIALTGSTGFIGTHVRRLLSSADHDVLLVVRNQSAVHLLGQNEKVLLADIGEVREDWFNYLGRPDVLLHLAWGGLPNYLDKYHVDVELPLQVNFLTKIVRSGLRNLVVTGTCYEYGLASGALGEGQETNPNTPYGVAKDRLRKSVSVLHHEYDFKFTWARIFYPYGEGQSELSIYSQLKRAVLDEERKFKMSSGKQALDFIPVESVASALVSLSTNQEGMGIINIGSGKPQTVLDFIQDQIQKLGSQIVPQVGAIPDRKFESHAFWADISKLKSLNI